MDEQKEKLLENLRAFNDVNVKNVLKELGMNSANLYTKRYTVEKMQLVYNTFINELIKELKKQGQI